MTQIISNIAAGMLPTPVVRVDCFDTGPCDLFLKLETKNCTGSIKDRIALPMLEAAKRQYGLGSTNTVVEATSGNTGISLARICMVKGLRLMLVVPDKVAAEKIALMKMFGAEVMITRSDVAHDHPAFYQNAARRLATKIPGSIYLNQFANPANADAHERGTAPELWEQMGHRLDAIVCGVGSGGTLTGLSRYFERVRPELQLVLADPEGSTLCEYVQTGQSYDGSQYLVEGIGGNSVPALADLSRISEAIPISDFESFTTAQALLRRSGIMVGPSTGTLLAASLRYCRKQIRARRVLTFACDSGARYLSTLFNDAWMAAHRFVPGSGEAVASPVSSFGNLPFRRHFTETRMLS